MVSGSQRRFGLIVTVAIVINLLLVLLGLGVLNSLLKYVFHIEIPKALWFVIEIVCFVFVIAADVFVLESISPIKGRFGVMGTLVRTTIGIFVIVGIFYFVVNYLLPL